MTIVIVVALGIFPPAGWVRIDVDDYSFELKGTDLEYNATLRINCGTMYDIDDVHIRAQLIDEERGSLLRLNDSHLGTIHGGSVEEISIDGSIFTPTALLIIRDMVSDDGSVITMKLDVSFRYMMGLVEGKAEAYVGISLSEPGSHLIFNDIEDSTTDYVIGIDNLRRELRPDDATAQISDGSTTLHASIRNVDESTILSFSSDDLDENISKLIDSHGLTVTVDGEKMQIDESTVKTVLKTLQRIRG